MAKWFLIVLSASLLSIHASGRKQIRYDYSGGISLMGSVKLPIWGSAPVPSPFFRYGAGGYLYIARHNDDRLSCWSGHPKALSYLIKGEATMDMITYMLEQRKSITLEVFGLDFNPEIAFPSGLRKIQYTIGAGLRVNFPGATGTATTVRNTAHSAPVDLNAIADQASARMRRWIPYVSGGVYVSGLPGQKGDKINLQLSLQQLLVNLFRRPVPIIGHQMGPEPDRHIDSYFPLMAQLSIGYRLL